jgi:IS30 family transposase
MAKVGRPKAIIDWKKVDGYLRAGCSGTAIAGILGIHHDTLYDACQRDHKTEFSLYSQQKKAEGISLVRATLYQKALQDKDNTCLIFLAKTDGGMKETQVNENINNQPLEVRVKITKDDLTSDSIE